MLTKNLFVISLGLLLFTACQTVSSQTGTVQNNNSSQIKTEDDSGYYPLKGLSYDYKMADAVLYVDVKKRQLVDSIGNADCDNDIGGGYCLYLLEADIKEVFKGNLSNEKTFIFYNDSDASYPKKNLMGEQVVFLKKGDIDKTNTEKYFCMDNSTRFIEHNVLEKMRNIINPLSAVDENDEESPYSFASIKNNYKEANTVLYVEVISFKPSADNIEHSSYDITAVVKEVFKGKLKAGQKFEYNERPEFELRKENVLVKQVLYLEKTPGSEKPIYRRLDYVEEGIQHNILEKLRKIAKGS